MKNYKKILTNTLYWIALVGLFFWFAYTKGWILADFRSVDAQTAITMIENDDNITLLDVRTVPEYKEGHLVDATLIPLQQLNTHIDKLSNKKDTKIVVYCQSGNRSVAASRILEKHGFTPINVKGGIIALKSAGAQIIK
ncbi:rhodanese-like domain-containing protein [Sulfurovum sp. zt1-1]|uniref:Rhodanese-like domain-containing protein n=1 Tax=Sulfurovum zhangzhouensis TaxID=3019067 RepID=A0ABT7QXH8_9BACT|nr:rhodanese-like domain-containing protein [Sulfurovum zhangzhouensis]MDM5271498.1 rhodanese-like domain-containing protein [Sulfurovum zhangzhouensis]